MFFAKTAQLTHFSAIIFAFLVDKSNESDIILLAGTPWEEIGSPSLPA